MQEIGYMLLNNMRNQCLTTWPIRLINSGNILTLPFIFPARRAAIAYSSSVTMNYITIYLLSVSLWIGQVFGWEIKGFPVDSLRKDHIFSVIPTSRLDLKLISYTRFSGGIKLWIKILTFLASFSNVFFSESLWNTCSGCKKIKFLN